MTSHRTGKSLCEHAHKVPGTPAIGPAQPWKCRRCRLETKPGQTLCAACEELRLEWKADAEREEDMRQSDREIVL